MKFVDKRLRNPSDTRNWFEREFLFLIPKNKKSSPNYSKITLCAIPETRALSEQGAGNLKASTDRATCANHGSALQTVPLAPHYAENSKAVDQVRCQALDALAIVLLAFLLVMCEKNERSRYIYDLSVLDTITKEQLDTVVDMSLAKSGLALLQDHTLWNTKLRNGHNPREYLQERISDHGRRFCQSHKQFSNLSASVVLGKSLVNFFLS